MAPLRLAPTLVARPGMVSGSFLAPPGLFRPVFLDLDIRPSLVGDGISTVTTASPDTGQARGGGGETIKPARAVASTPTAMLPLPGKSSGKRATFRRSWCASSYLMINAARAYRDDIG